MTESSPTSPFSALRHRNFRLLWSSQLVSMAGSMMQSAALLWHVSLLVPPAGRGVALGLVGLVRVLPIIGFSLVAGVFADAHDRRRLMLVTQAGMAVSAGLLAWLSFAGLHALWPVYLLAAAGAGFGAFDNPARNALIPTLVPREQLAGAISLNTIMFQAASVIGPALGGVVIAIWDVGWAYAANAASFLCVIAALLAMRDLPARAEGTAAKADLGAAIDGLKFVFGAPLIRSTMLLDFFATFFASATALLPIFAQDVLHVGAHGYGLLAAAPSVGAIVAGLFMVRAVHRIELRGVVLLWAVAIYGLATVAFGLSRTFSLTLLCLALSGAADTVSMVIRQIVRQLATPDHLRGRMTGVNMVFFMGGPQLGELEAGLLAGAWGAPLSVVTGGVGCLVAVAWVAARTPQLRAYRRSTPLAAGAVAATAGR
jgi:MFS family permease